MTLAHWQTIITLVAFFLAAGIALYSWRQMRSVSMAVMIWFALALFASQRGFFESKTVWSSGDLVGFSIFGTLMSLPLIALFIGWRRYAKLRSFLSDIPLPVLIGVEVYRIAGAIFWWMYIEEMMPPEMGIFTGFADVFIGITALPLAWAVARGMWGSRRLAIGWNLFGISDFLIAVSMVSLSIFGLISLQPAPVYIGLHPLALIALFQLPLSIAIHVLALRQLISHERTDTWQPSSSSVPPKASA